MPFVLVHESESGVRWLRSLLESAHPLCSVQLWFVGRGASSGASVQAWLREASTSTRARSAQVPMPKRADTDKRDIRTQANASVAAPHRLLGLVVSAATARAVDLLSQPLPRRTRVIVLSRRNRAKRAIAAYQNMHRRAEPGTATGLERLTIPHAALLAHLQSEGAHSLRDVVCASFSLRAALLAAPNRSMMQTGMQPERAAWAGAGKHTGDSMLSLVGAWAGTAFAWAGAAFAPLHAAPPEPLHWVDYEDLLHETQRTLQRLYLHLGLGSAEARVASAASTAAAPVAKRTPNDLMLGARQLRRGVRCSARVGVERRRATD